MIEVEVRVLKDPDGRWTSNWPPALVASGRSPGVGRHDTRSCLLAAIRAAGWELMPVEVGAGRWSARKVAA